MGGKHASGAPRRRAGVRDADLIGPAAPATASKTDAERTGRGRRRAVPNNGPRAALTTTIAAGMVAVATGSVAYTTALQPMAGTSTPPTGTPQPEPSATIPAPAQPAEHDSAGTGDRPHKRQPATDAGTRPGLPLAPDAAAASTGPAATPAGFPFEFENPLVPVPGGPLVLGPLGPPAEPAGQAPGQAAEQIAAAVQHRSSEAASDEHGHSPASPGSDHASADVHDQHSTSADTAGVSDWFERAAPHGHSVEVAARAEAPVHAGQHSDEHGAGAGQSWGAEPAPGRGWTSEQWFEPGAADAEWTSDNWFESKPSGAGWTSEQWFDGGAGQRSAEGDGRKSGEESAKNESRSGNDSPGDKRDGDRDRDRDRDKHAADRGDADGKKDKSDERGDSDDEQGGSHRKHDKSDDEQSRSGSRHGKSDDEQDRSGSKHGKSDDEQDRSGSKHDKAADTDKRDKAGDEREKKSSSRHGGSDIERDGGDRHGGGDERRGDGGRS